mgnify:CR=1 FL=1|jgi:hypothetical protein
MIKFFRKIRQNMLSEGKSLKYLKYAIGEIVLVVIGILIALQINNWNESRKNGTKEKEYLEGIKTDLEIDVKYIDHFLPLYESRMQRYSALDTLVKVRSTKIFEIDVAEISNLTKQMGTIYPRNGSYSSLISDNSTGLITNKDLLKQVKGLYEYHYVRVLLLGQELDDISTQIQWETRLDFRQNLSGYTFEDFDKLFADLGILDRNVRKYNRRLYSLKEDINKRIELIKEELNKK